MFFVSSLLVAAMSLSLAFLIMQRNPPLHPDHRYVLRAMLAGATLKAHRTVDGQKTHMLHPLVGPAEVVDRAAVETLVRHGLIASNMKFPAATYVLTERGIAAVK